MPTAGAEHRIGIARLAATATCLLESANVRGKVEVLCQEGNYVDARQIVRDALDLTKLNLIQFWLLNSLIQLYEQHSQLQSP